MLIWTKNVQENYFWENNFVGGVFLQDERMRYCFFLYYIFEKTINQARSQKLAIGGVHWSGFWRKSHSRQRHVGMVATMFSIFCSNNLILDLLWLKLTLANAAYNSLVKHDQTGCVFNLVTAAMIKI